MLETRTKEYVNFFALIMFEKSGYNQVIETADVTHMSEE